MGKLRSFYLLLVGFGALILSPQCDAQGRGATSTQAPKPQVYAALGQVMKGIMFPASNVIFAAQRENPADVKPAKDPSTATDALDGSYGKWEAVENSALAIAEAANLLILPGRKCSNGRDVPVKNPDWSQLVQGLRDAAMTTYKAAQSKNQDKMVEAAATLNAACANCHDRYRVANDLLPLVEKANLADRCK
ncbi:MAG: cytochrome c [Bryobacteraceae bacterium]